MDWLNDLSRGTRLLLAAFLMSTAGGLTLAAFLIGRTLLDNSPQATRVPTESALLPLVLKTEILPAATLLPTNTPSSTPSASPTPLVTSTNAFTPSVTLTPSITFTPSIVATLTPFPTVIIAAPTQISAAASPAQSSNACQPPADWVQHTVQAGETLFAFQLGTDSAVTVDQIIAANCLQSRMILEGQSLWLPVGAAENAPSSDVAPTPLPTDASAPPAPVGLSRAPRCPCQITIQEGWRLEQIAEVVDSVPVGFTGADFLAVARNGSTFAGREFLAGTPATFSLEGYIYPTGYTVTNEMDAAAFITLALDAFGAATGAIWGDAAAKGLTPYQVVTLASIINRESRSSDQQVMVASVFHNRLATGRNLGATVTTQYAIGRSGNWWPNAAGSVSNYDSPYNTNIYTGLPPSPICSPSLSAIRAAVYPAQTNYLFFTGNCRGSGNAYAETYEQHLANVRCQ